MDVDTLRLVTSVLGIFLGLIVLLLGVLQDAGQSLNSLTLAGGAVMLVAVWVLTTWEMGGAAEA